MEQHSRDITRRNLLRTTGVLAGGSVTGGGLLTYGSSPASAATGVIDDFEDSDLSEYSFDRGSSGASLVTSPTHSGSYALSLTDVAVEMISRPGGSTPDLPNYPSAGDTFRYNVYATGGVQYTNYTYGVQDHRNRYFVRIDFAGNRFRLYKYADGNTTELVRDDTITVSEDQWYELEVDWVSNGTHTITLLDDTDSQVGQLSATDETWTSGGIGYDGYMDDGGTLYIDDVLLGDSSDDGSGGDDGGGSSVIEDFEDGGLTEYAFDRGSSGASLVSSPVYTGSSALEISDTDTEMISTSGLDTYPKQGETFRFRFRSPTNEVANLSYGVQDHDNRYFVQLDYADQYLKLLRWQNDTGDQFGLATNVSYTTGVWYEVEVEWRTDGTHVVTLYDDAGSEVAQMQGSDATWTSGGIGFDGYYAGGGAGYYDYVTSGFVRKLGMFEDGFDGWTTSEDHQLTRVKEADKPGSTTEGSYGLEMQTGTSLPQVENTQRFQNGDCSNAPCFVADVTGHFENSDADLNLQLTYHRSDGGSAESSSTVRMSQWDRGHMTWDMNELPDAALENPERIELVCYPRDQPPGSTFDYTGEFWLDNIRLTRSADEHSNNAMETKMATYKTMFGQMTESIIDTETDTVEEGRFVYSDGTEKNYHYEQLSEDKAELTIDGEVFKRGGGW
jgi:hypothetical protein